MWSKRLFTLLGVILLSALLAGVLLVAASPPRGAPVSLLPAATMAPLWVDISGAVNQPGLYELPPGSRVLNALTAAGGLAANAAVEQVNQTALLHDGEKIVIPSVGADGFSSSPANKTQNLAVPAEKKVNLNTASQDELMELPGIGATKAASIITYREAHSGFQSIEEIQEVDGIGPETFESLKDLLTTQ